MPDLLYAGFSNAIWLVLAGDTFPKSDYRKLRDVARAALAFQRAGDPLGGALTMTPWLKYVAPKFFGFTPIVENNKILLDFMKVIFFLTNFLCLAIAWPLRLLC